MLSTSDKRLQGVNIMPGLTVSPTICGMYAVSSHDEKYPKLLAPGTGEPDCRLGPHEPACHSLGAIWVQLECTVCTQQLTTPYWLRLTAWQAATHIVDLHLLRES